VRETDNGRLNDRTSRLYSNNSIMNNACVMTSLTSSALTATLQALRGETDVHIVAPALDDQRFARILALAPGVDPVISALGALAGGLPDFLTPAMCASSALHTAIASLIGTRTGNCVLPTWAEVAPAGWGASHAAALIDAVQHNRCASWAAAALIGPGDVSAALLHEPWEMSAAIRRWGEATSDNPTAWMDALTPTERDRLLDALRHAPNTAAACLPWLPEPYVMDIAGHIDGAIRPLALAAYTAASPVACARHAAILTAFMQHVEADDISILARLAAATRMDAVWEAIVRLLRKERWLAGAVVMAAPWEHVRGDVQAGILSGCHQSNACAAIAFARGVHSDPQQIMGITACAFFAAVTPTVWHALPTEMQQAWIRQLAVRDAHLAVRSLGPDPMFLACAALNDDLIAAVRRHTPDDTAVRWTLLPVAVRNLPIAAVPAVVAALPAPPDPAAFMQIACGGRKMSPALRDWIVDHPSPCALGAATTVMRTTARFDSDSSGNRCAALAHALEGWGPEETAALLAALPDDVRAALLPDHNVLADALAHPDRRDAFLQALGALAALPPSAALPALHALDALAQTTKVSAQRHAGKVLAMALRDYGRIFADIARSLDDVARAAVLPRLDHPHDESAMETLAAADPLVAHRLAQALRSHNATAALDALAASALDEMLRLWRFLPGTIHSAVLGNRDALLTDVAAPECADALAQTLREWSGDNDVLLLALRMLCDSEEKRRTWGVALLAQHPDRAAALLPLLREDLRTMLASDPAIAFACADLPLSHPSAPTQRRRR